MKQVTWFPPSHYEWGMLMKMIHKLYPADMVTINFGPHCKTTVPRVVALAKIPYLIKSFDWVINQDVINQDDVCNQDVINQDDVCNQDEPNQDFIVQNEISLEMPDCGQVLKKYCENQNLHITEENYVNVMSCANFLQIQPLIDMCNRYFQTHVLTAKCEIEKIFEIENNDVFFTNVILKRLADKFSQVFRYYFLTHTVVDETGIYGYEEKVELRDNGFKFKKFIHYNADDMDYVTRFTKKKFLSGKSWIELVRLLSVKFGDFNRKDNSDLCKFILLHLGILFRKGKHVEMYALFDKVCPYIRWRALTLSDIKQFKIFAKKKPEYFRDLMFDLVVGNSAK